MSDSADNGKHKIQDPKNIAIALLVLIVIVMGFLLVKNYLKPEGEEETVIRKDAAGGVSVVEVKFDTQDNKFVDIVFNKPIGKGENGEIIGRDQSARKRCVALEKPECPELRGVVQIQHGDRLHNQAECRKPSQTGREAQREDRV